MKTSRTSSMVGGRLGESDPPAEGAAGPDREAGCVEPPRVVGDDDGGDRGDGDGHGRPAATITMRNWSNPLTAAPITTMIATGSRSIKNSAVRSRSKRGTVVVRALGRDREYGTHARLTPAAPCR
ncbi:hypothetical protein ACQB60_15845 [Actinomycetota bacterium Odt1-20B]